MARVTATKIRQFFIAPGTEVAEGTDPETIELFTPDGEPYEAPAGGGSGGMNWAGVWSGNTAYEKDDVVRLGERLWIAHEISISAGLPSPENLVTIPPGSYLAEYGPFVSARGVADGGVILVGDGSTDEVFFFDISDDDTVTIDDIVDDQISTMDFYDTAGEYLDIDPSYESGSEDPLVIADLDPGRYFIRVSRYDPPVVPGTPEFTVNPSIPGILADYSDNWELVL